MTKPNVFDPYAFVVHTERITLDGETQYKSTVFELPDVAIYESTPAESYEATIDCISSLHEAAIEDGRPFPMPEKRESEEFSGRVTLRMRKELHRRLDLQAKRNGSTLNAEIVSQLSDTSSIREFAVQLSAEMKTSLAIARRHPSEKPLILATQLSSVATGFFEIVDLSDSSHSSGNREFIQDAGKVAVVSSSASSVRSLIPDSLSSYHSQKSYEH